MFRFTFHYLEAELNIYIHYARIALKIGLLIYNFFFQSFAPAV